MIESDDWGTIRMPNKYVFNSLLKQGIAVDKCPFNTYDTLASPDDLNALFEVLSSFKDVRGQSPKITANTIVANPDFERIAAANFQSYHFEHFTETLQKYPLQATSFLLWEQGMKAGLFVPQFHGREHLQVARWLQNLREGLPQTKLAFEQQVFGLSTTITSEKRRSYMAAYDCETAEELETNKQIIAEGLDIFKSIFGYQSTTFIAPNYTWSDALNETLAANGVQGIQSGWFQILPIYEQSEKTNPAHFSGQKNERQQYYLVRNCAFEPATATHFDHVGACLQAIKTAFRWGKPAIINSHRLNFIGSLEERNRSQNLAMLKELLTTILKKWPDVEFKSSNELLNLYADE